MSFPRVRWIVAGVCLTGLIAGGVGAVLSQNDAEPVAPATLIPQNSLLYVSCDGRAAHQAGFENTAAYEAFYKSGLMDVVGRATSAILESMSGGEAAALSDIIKKLSENGITAGLTLSTAGGPALPFLTVVVHNGAELEPAVGRLVQETMGRQVEFATEELRSRQVTSGVIPNSPGIEIGWWKEGNHLMLAAGLGAINSTLDVATGDAENVTTSEVYQKFAANEPAFERTTMFWLDFGLLRRTYGEVPLPNPEPVTVNAVVEALGLSNLGVIVSQCGYKDRANWTETFVEAKGEKKGLLALCEQEPITLDDLPPIPFGTNGFYATSFDWGKAYDTILAVVQDMAVLGPPEAAAQLDAVPDLINQAVGFDLRNDLLGSLGNVMCLYGDTRQGFLGLGMGVAIEVTDEDKLLSSLRIIGQRIADENPGDVIFRESAKQGREVFLIEPASGFFSIAVGVDEKWLVAGLPQTVEGFFLRQDGALTNWKPTPSYQEGLDLLPKEFTTINAVDPRKSYRALLGAAPLFLSGIEGAMRQQNRDFSLPVGMADIPPAELIARPLFPNLSVTTVDENGIHCTSRSSAPAIPFIDGIGGGGGVATASTMVALLLPAVQQAREAARRTQSRNNMKQLGLALHNYHDTYRSFPQGTVETEGLEPDERLSWLASVLPFLDQANLYNQINFKEGWNEDANQALMKTVVPVFVNPGYAIDPAAEWGTTHYVGIAGVGEKAAELDKTDNKAGIFGYNRKTEIRDITDGTSNTMMVSEANDDVGPWGQGGKATIRGLSKKPYINGPDGIGGPYRGGCHVLFGDGAVRFVSENIDAKTFEALATMHGGEVVGEF
ncbi:MAG: DUF1559 domain-containing protein [Planctomycetaceae bacterium]